MTRVFFKLLLYFPILDKSRIIPHHPRMKPIISHLAFCLVAAASLRAAEPIFNKPIDPKQLTRVSFGSYSHWLQPWRGYLETMPAAHFLDGLGIVLNTHRGEDAGQILRMCAKNGIKHARVELGWGNLDYDDETKIHNAKDAAARLLACKAAGIRPLILLNGHHGAPCPLKNFERAVAADAEAGAREVVIDKTDGLIVGHSGLGNPQHYVAAEFLITKIDGNKVALSKPLPNKIAAGTKVRMATLKYAPFGDAGTDEGKATLDGWKRYARTIADFAATTLGTKGARDLGFDLEIWNEMSFGSNFIDQNRYYDPPLRRTPLNDVYRDIVRATADAAEAEPALFAGVRLENGFSNTLPWPASSEMPARVTALSHHPYAGRKIFPKDKLKGAALNALGLPDKSGFEPGYEECFPEYFASALQTETIVRDMAPLATNIGKTAHGRFTRPGNPCWCWITEVNYAPGEDGVTDPARALQLKTKAIARYFCFYLNKGVERLYLFAAGANDPKQGDLELGVLKQDFVNRTINDKTYPTDDAPWTSPALLVVRRIADRMRDGLDASLRETRALEIASIEDSHGAKQFDGDPNDPSAHPPLFDRDVLAVLPFQVNAKKFVIPFYVVTRDIRRDLPEEKFTVAIKGLAGKGAKLTAYDPVLDRRKDVRVVSAEGDTLKLELAATDYPVLLEVEEAR
jgi:hypothetical protein